MTLVQTETLPDRKSEKGAGMSRRRLDLFDAGFLFFVFLFALNVPEGLFSLGGPPPVVTQALFVGFAGLVLLVRSAIGKPLFEGRDLTVLAPALAWILAWVILSTIGYLMSGMREGETEFLIARYKAALILFLLLVLVGQLPSPIVLARVMVVVALCGLAVAVFDFFTATFSSVLSRAAGFYQNANQGGEALVLMMTAGIVGLPVRWRLPFLAAVTVGIILTFSRSSWVALVIVTTSLFWQGELGFRRQRRLIGLLVILAVGALGLSILNGSLANFVSGTWLAEYLDANTLARLGQEDFGADDAASERKAVVFVAWNAFWAGTNPLLGYGIAHTLYWEFRVGPHNMFLLYLVEHGLVGLGIYLWLLGILLVRSVGPARLMAVALLVFSFSTHNMLDSPWRISAIAFILLSPIMMRQGPGDGTEDGDG